MIEIKARPLGPYTSVTGWIDGQQIIEITDQISGIWGISMWLGTPPGLPEAREWLECCHRTMVRAKEYGAP
jgi:hypothetical protein